MRPKGKERTEFVGFERYMTELKVLAGLADPRLERIKREMKAADAFFGTDDDDDGVKLP